MAASHVSRYLVLYTALRSWRLSTEVMPQWVEGGSAIAGGAELVLRRAASGRLVSKRRIARWRFTTGDVVGGCSEKEKHDMDHLTWRDVVDYIVTRPQEHCLD